MRKIIFSGLFLILLLIILEVILSFFGLFPNDFYTATPNSSFEWEIGNDEIIGITQNSTVSFDHLGARTTSKIENKKNKIAVFGGSTTACFALSQENTWTALLEKKLGDTYWVGNFGRPGNYSNHHVLQFQHILNKKELKDVNTVLILQGVNDFIGYLISPERYLNSSEDYLNKIAFQHLPNSKYSFLERLVLYKLAKKAKQNINFQLNHKQSLTEVANKIKAKRQQSKLVDSLPPLEKGLLHYKKNTQKLIDLAKEKGVKIVFLTQPTIWKENLEPKYEQLLLTSGFENNSHFYSTSALNEGMKKFNEALKETCSKNNIEYIELNLPKNTTVFYDDYHFNESGAIIMATEIYNNLLKKSVN